MWYSEASACVGWAGSFPKRMTKTTGFIIPFMPCLQSTYRYLNKRASSKLQQPNRAVKTLMPFATTYLCESGFLALTSMKTKYRHRLCVEMIYDWDSLQYNPTLQSYVHPFQHTLLIDLWWVIHNFRWTNKVLYVIWLNKELNDWLLLCYYLCPRRALCHFPRAGLWQQLTLILMFNKYIVGVCVEGLQWWQKNNIWECADPGARGGTAGGWMFEGVRDYGKLGNHCDRELTTQGATMGRVKVITVTCVVCRGFGNWPGRSHWRV